VTTGLTADGPVRTKASSAELEPTWRVPRPNANFARDCGQEREHRKGESRRRGSSATDAGPESLPSEAFVRVTRLEAVQRQLQPHLEKQEEDSELS
jgi:hypothetical protein